MELQSGALRIASYRQKLPRKAKNIYLPTEVWVDVFCFSWTTRKRMAQMVDKIGNRWFGEQLQFYLHEWGKHTMRELYFTRQGVLKRHNYHYQYQQLEYPQTATPENIKFCKSFEIYHFDNKVYNFFRRIQSLLTANTKLDICYMPSKFDKQVENMRSILGHLVPFIDGIHTVKTDDRMLPTVKANMREKFNKIKVLDVQFTRFVQSAMKPIMEWLTSSNEPKLLHLKCVNDVKGQQVLDVIHKQFIEANKPSTFAVNFYFNYDLVDFKCGNTIGEQLCGIRNNAHFKVFRHQANAEAGDRLRAWVDGNGYSGVQCKGYIKFLQPSIGRGRIFAMPDLDEEADNEEKEDDNEKPSTSKKRRISK